MERKKNKLRQLVVLLSIVLLLASGCMKLSSVTGQKSDNPEVTAMAQWKKAFRQHLPQGAFLIEPSQDGVTLPQPELIQHADLDTDGIPELIAGYRVGESNVGVLVLKQVDGSWQKLWEARGAGPGLTLLHLADVTGDGTPELLVGWGLGDEASNQLNIITLQEDIRILAEKPYDRLDILNVAGVYGDDSKTKLAIWNRVGSNTYETEVYRYFQGQLVPAPDTYQSYFPQVVQYYEQQALAMPDQADLWCYLADAQLKAGEPEKALQSIERAAHFDSELYRPRALAVLKADALLAQGKLQEALKTYPKLARVDPEGIDRRDKARAYYGLGRVKESLPGVDPQAAKADYKKAQAADPNWLLPDLALERIEAVPLTRTLSTYLNSLAPEKRTEGIDKLAQFAQEHNISINYLSQSVGKERLRLVVADYGPLDQPVGNSAHALFWWDGLSDVPVRSQVFYSAEAAFHGLCRNCALTDMELSIEPDNTVQAELTYTLAKETNHQELRYKLKLTDNGWQIIKRDLRR